jgi:hypothetical protein
LGLRFQRRIRIFPGLRANFSKNGMSISVGRKGAWWTVGPNGQRVTVGLGLPGLYWTEKLPPAPPPSSPSSARNRVALVIGVIMLALAIATWLWA